RRFSLAAQLLHAGTYGREVIGSTRSVHGVSSHPLCQVLVALYSPAGRCGTILRWLIFRGKPSPERPRLTGRWRRVDARFSHARTRTSKPDLCVIQVGGAAAPGSRPL